MIQLQADPMDSTLEQETFPAELCLSIVIPVYNELKTLEAGGGLPV